MIDPRSLARLSGAPRPGADDLDVGGEPLEPPT